jgi:hypothetical protein
MPQSAGKQRTPGLSPGVNHIVAAASRLRV